MKIFDRLLGPHELIKRVANLDDSFEAISAANKLGELKDRRAVNSLIKALNADYGYTRKAAVEALGKIGDHRATEPLILALESDDSYIESEAARALGEIGDHRAVENLISALSSDADYLKVEAAKALGLIGDERAIDPLIELSGDGFQTPNWVASKTIASFGDLAVSKLITICRNSKSTEYMIEKSLYTLGDIKSRESVRAIIDLLDHENSNIREAALKNLENVSEPDRLKSLTSVIQDCDESNKRLVEIENFKNKGLLDDKISNKKGWYVLQTENAIYEIETYGPFAINELQTFFQTSKIIKKAKSLESIKIREYNDARWICLTDSSKKYHEGVHLLSLAQEAQKSMQLYSDNEIDINCAHCGQYLSNDIKITQKDLTLVSQGNFERLEFENVGKPEIRIECVYCYGMNSVIPSSKDPMAFEMARYPSTLKLFFTRKRSINFPYGCPFCNPPKPVLISGFHEHRKKITFNCCDHIWKIEIRKNDWSIHQSMWTDSSNNLYYCIETCPKCGSEESFYYDMYGKFRSNKCKKCNFYESEDIY